MRKLAHIRWLANVKTIIKQLTCISERYEFQHVDLQVSKKKKKSNQAKKNFNNSSCLITENTRLDKTETTQYDKKQET